MKSVEFCYWLQGWFELNQTTDHREGCSKETLAVIEKHLAMVFKHEIDPSYPQDQQKDLNNLHGEIKKFKWPDFGATAQYNPNEHLLRC